MRFPAAFHARLSRIINSPQVRVVIPSPLHDFGLMSLVKYLHPLLWPSRTFRFRWDHKPGREPGRRQRIVMLQQSHRNCRVSERGRERETDRQTDRETDRQTETERQTDRQTDRQRQTETDRQTETETERQRQTHRHTDKQAGR